MRKAHAGCGGLHARRVVKGVGFCLWSERHDTLIAWRKQDERVGHVTFCDLNAR